MIPGGLTSYCSPLCLSFSRPWTYSSCSAVLSRPWSSGDTTALGITVPVTSRFVTLMRRLMQVAERVSVIALALASAALAQDPIHATKGSVLDAVALPGEMYVMGGTLSPYEKSDVQVDSYFEQRAVVFSTWDNSLTVTPYASMDLLLD